MVEIKLEHNPEIQNKSKRIPYKEKLEQYLAANKNKPGLYLVFSVRKTENREKRYHEMVKEYSDMKNLHIERIDCT